MDEHSWNKTTDKVRWGVRFSALTKEWSQLWVSYDRHLSCPLVEETVAGIKSMLHI